VIGALDLLSPQQIRINVPPHAAARWRRLRASAGPAAPNSIRFFWRLSPFAIPSALSILGVMSSRQSGAVALLFLALVFGIFIGYSPASVAHAQLASRPSLAPGIDCATGQVAPKSEYSVDVSPLPLGAYAASSLSADFTNAAGSVTPNTYWTASSTKYLIPTNGAQFILASNYCSRDMEVETWTHRGRVYLRLTPAGMGIFFDLNDDTPNGTLIIGIATSTTEAKYAPGDYRYLYSNDNLAGTIPGFSKTGTDAQRFTFGVAGFDIYAKFNGVEFMRIKDFHHLSKGRAAIKAIPGHGIRSTTVRNFADSPFMSNIAAGIYDPRDFGFRAIQTTGSINAGSNTLMLAEPTTFAVGDYVIVEIGKEPGAGMRGTKGVGGTWPARSYPDLATMQADTSQADGTYAWREDTGDVLRFASASSSWAVGGYSWYTLGTAQWGQDVYGRKYYPAKAIPRALQARVIAVSNNVTTLTLDQTAAVSVSGANVYLDVGPIINFLTGLDIWYKFGGIAGDLRLFTPANMQVPIPAGTYAIGGAIIIGQGRSNNVFYGQGSSTTTLFTPKGMASAGIQLNGTSNTVRDLHLTGNFGDNGFGLNWATTLIPFGYGSTGMEETHTSNGSAVTESFIPQGVGFPVGIFMTGAHLKVQDVKVSNVWWAATGAQYCNDCWAYRVASDVTDPFQTYIQWQFEWGNSLGGGCVDCVVTSPRWLIPGFAIALSKNTQFIRPKGINAVFDSNSSGGFLFQDPQTTIKAMSQFSTSSFSAMGWIMNINSNLANSFHTNLTDPLLKLGGEIVNPHFVVEGPINASNNGLPGIVIGAYTPNVTVTGGYIEGPNWAAPSTINTPVGIVSQGTNTVIDGVRVVGTVKPDLFPRANIALFGGGASATGTQVVRNCIADLILLGSKEATKENCISNAQYLAPQ
jgi:hypothetical protein